MEMKFQEGDILIRLNKNGTVSIESEMNFSDELHMIIDSAFDDVRVLEQSDVISHITAMSRLQDVFYNRGFDIISGSRSHYSNEFYMRYVPECEDE